MASKRDRELGMDRTISRRDFLDGAARGIAGAAALAALPRGAAARAAGEPGAVAYPPARQGARGHHAGSFEVMHALRDGSFWRSAGMPEPTGERYDLVVVGGGISGLAAAFVYRQQAGPGARVLVLENHDDFGGHAKRNEFTASNGRKLIGYGGSQSLQTPSYFSPAVSQLLRDLALDLGRFDREFYDREWFDRRGLGDAWFFPKEAFGRDALVRETEGAAGWVPQAPLSERAKADLVRLIDDPPDYLAGHGRAEKLELLSKITYRDFLLDVAKADPQLVQVYQESTTAYFGVGIDATTALDAWGNWNPGFAGMDLGERPYRTMSPSGRLALTDPDPYVYHFPDGNHGVARALVRALVPAALPGSTMEDLATADVAYGALDDPASPVRLRLNATAVKVRHEGGDPGTAGSVAVQYATGGRLREVTGGHVVLACWHTAVPYLTDEIGEDQRAALLDQKKVPLVYTNVQIRSWEAFDRLKVRGFTAPGHFWRGAEIDFPVSMGDYRFADKPEDPVVLHLAKVPVKPGLPSREQARAGRAWVAATPFEEMERQARDLLARALGGGGFDPARDVEGITVNRWAHGYAYEYMRPWDAFWPDGPLPIETARKGWGRVAVANADSGAYAYAHGAIDQAVRAVRELLGTPEGAPPHADFPGPPRGLIGL